MRGKRIPIVLVLLGVPFLICCSTDFVPEAPELRSEALEQVERKEPDEKREDAFLKAYSSDFKKMYESKNPWTNYMLVYLGVRFLEKDGIRRYRNGSNSTPRGYPGIHQFLKHVKKHGGKWSYLGHLAKKIKRRPLLREKFRSGIQFQPYLNFSLAMQMKTSGINPLEGGNVNLSDKQHGFEKPLIRSLVSLINTQYFVWGYKQVQEDQEPLRDWIRKELEMVLDDWRRHLNELRPNWNSKYDLPMVSLQNLRYFERNFTDRFQYEFFYIDGMVERGKGPVPHGELHRTSVNQIPGKIRSLHSSAIESFVEGRFQSTLRSRVKILAYFLITQEMQEVMNGDDLAVKNTSYYVNNSLNVISQILHSH